MKANELLIESKNKRTSNIPLIMVDIQPEYRFHTSSFINEAMEFINQRQGKTLVLINADETGITTDTKQDVIHYYFENGMSEEARGRIGDIYDKGYGYLRDWMDYIPPKIIIKMIRLMYKRGVSDVRELDINDIKLAIGNDWIKGAKIHRKTFSKPIDHQGELNDLWIEEHQLSVNWLPIKLLAKYSPCYIIGGGVNECLAEVALLMSAFNLKYKVIKQFTY